jgi:basic amino acid/polyamine antiporter, APA family
MAPPATSAILQRPAKLGRWMATSLVVGNMIGSGVFLLPAALAPLGWDSVGGWLFTIAGGMCLAAMFSRLARVLPREGGLYAYTLAAFGPLTAFLVAWSYWASNIIGLAAIAVAAISYLAALAPTLAAVPGVQIGATCLLIWALTLLNMRGARDAGAFQLATTGLKLLPLVAVILIAATALATHRAVIPALGTHPFSGAGITSAATLTLWAMLGLETATVPADKIDDPERTIPFATIFGTAATGIVYLVTCSAVVLLMPAATLAQSGAPFADFVRRFWGPGPASLIALFAAISGIGALNGWILVQAELTRAMALGGGFPRGLAIQSRRETPVRALILSAVLMSAVVLLNYSRSLVEIFEFLLLLATATSLFMYLVCALAALKMDRERRFPLAGRRAGMVLAILAAIYSLWTIYGAGFAAVAWGLALVIVGLPIFLWSRRAT